MSLRTGILVFAIVEVLCGLAWLLVVVPAERQHLDAPDAIDPVAVSPVPGEKGSRFGA